MVKDDKETHWTQHIQAKMRQYRLSEGRLRRILRHPQRREKGIAENTEAAMQPARLATRSVAGGTAGTKKPNEIWLMYQRQGKKTIMISAWRYPGVSPKGEPIIIPEDALEELKKFLTKK